MIYFLSGLALGLVVAWIAVRRNDAMHRDILISISKGWCDPDEAGNVGWYRFPDNAAEREKFENEVEALRESSMGGAGQ